MSNLIPKIQLKIIHIGLILVSVPLALGLMSTLCLNYALQKSIQTHKQMTRVAVTSAKIDKFVRDSIEFKGDLQAQDAQSESDRAHLKNDAEQLHDDLAELEKLVGLHAQYEEQLRDIIPVTREVIAAVDNSEEHGFKSKISDELFQSIDRIKYLADDHATLLLVDAEIGKHPPATPHPRPHWLITANSHRDQSVQQLLAWLIAANIIACPILVLYFSQNVVRRLRILISNTERFEKDKELLDPVSGKDEIAHLDHVFRSMANRIKVARAEKDEIERMRREYVAMIGHDLRTPLTAVQGTLTLLADGVYGDISDSGITKAKVAEQSITRLSNLANELLDVEKLESNKLPIKLEPVKLDSVIIESIRTLDGFAQYKNVKVEYTHSDFEVLADEKRLIQIIVNLLSNAIKFSSDGSKVELSAKLTKDDFVEVTVKDEGRGVSPEKRAEIFDRFKQAESSDAQNERGLGLGLAISKALVESHGGAIGVTSVKQLHRDARKPRAASDADCEQNGEQSGEQNGEQNDEEASTAGSCFWFTLQPASHRIRVPKVQAQKQEVV